MRSEARTDLGRIFDAAIEAVDPARLVEQAVLRGRDGIRIASHSVAKPLVIAGSVCVLGAGKASVAMAHAFEDSCEGTVSVHGAVIAPVGAEFGRLRRIEGLPGEHPFPGLLSEASTSRLVAAISERTADHYVFLMSGGASSLLVAPIPPLTLVEKQQVTRLLLDCGAAIEEINAVRKHLSALKGGRVLRLVHSQPVLTLILSDVVNDDPATIGSGPTVPDSTTYREAAGILRKYDIYHRCPPSVREILKRGIAGEIPETVRPGSLEARLAFPMVLASNATARAAAAAAARRMGYAVEVRSSALTGDTVNCAMEWFQAVNAACRGNRNVCLIAGGETTVRVSGGGKGGRNQEFALALVEPAQGRPVVILSAGSDGVDGPTEAAGAFVDGSSLNRAAGRGLDPSTFLRNHDSFSFFNELGDLYVTGPTGTNVMDLKIAVVRPPSAA